MDEGQLGIGEQLMVEMIDAIVIIPAAEFDRLIEELRTLIMDRQMTTLLDDAVNALVAAARRNG